MRTILVPLAFASALHLPLPATAAEAIAPEAAIEQLFTAEKMEEGWFAPSFLSAFPAREVEALLRTYIDEYGAFRSVSAGQDSFIIELERAEVPALIVLDPVGRITGLRLEEAIPLASLDEFRQTIAGLPGESALLITSNGQTVTDLNADRPMAVGSAVKLAILRAVMDRVNDGQLSWDQTFELDEAWRSLPSGILQDWPAGSPVTLATLANLMISRSDNTATDALIAIVGREAVESVTSRNTPFPTTRDLFRLKSRTHGDLYERWKEADVEGRREILAALAGEPLPALGDLVPQPTLAVEWHLTPRELCALIEDVRDQPAVSINPGVASRRDWKRIAYKGGSEAGVLNLTTWLEGAEGDSHCVVATWNDAGSPLDQRRLKSAYRGMLRNLATGTE